MTEDYLNLVLMDDDTDCGGVAHSEETLAEFLDSIHMSYDTPLEEVNNALRNAGIMPIDPYEIRTCSACGKPHYRQDMLFTHDCHGIPFRLVCPDCYEELMEKGYDGEYYTESDEQIEDDY